MSSRHLITACGVLIVLALAFDPNRPRVAIGVLGGGVLAGLSYWGIRAGVDGILAGAAGRRRGSALVKFFTRHAILAVAAYGMMARFELDPVGMLIGVSALALAACVQGVRSGNAKPEP